MPLDVDLIADCTMSDLLRRLGVDWDGDQDKAERDEISARARLSRMDASRAFREFCEWHGLSGWSGRLSSVWEMLKAAELKEGE